MFQEKKQIIGPASRNYKMSTKGVRVKQGMGVVCAGFFLFFLLNAAGRFFLNPDEHLEQVIHRIMVPVTRFLDSAFKGYPDTAHVGTTVAGISGKNFSISIDELGNIKPFSPYHMTLTYDEEAIPGAIKGHFKDLVAQALAKVFLVPNALDVGMGRFMVLTFQKELLEKEKLTEHERIALDAVDQFSPEKEGDLPHISLVEWISGKEKQKGLKKLVTGDPAEIQETFEGTREYLQGWMTALMEMDPKDPKFQKKLKAIYEQVAGARTLYIFPPLTDETGVTLDLQKTDLELWDEFFMSGGVLNSQRAKKLIEYFKAYNWQRKPLITDMHPLMGDVAKIATEIEDDLLKELELQRHSSQERAEASALSSAKLLDETAFKDFQRNRAAQESLEEWYGTREKQGADIEIGEEAVQKAAVMGGDAQENPIITAARGYLTTIGGKTMSHEGPGGSWPKIQERTKKERKAAAKTFGALKKLLDKKKPSVAQVEELVEELRAAAISFGLEE